MPRRWAEDDEPTLFDLPLDQEAAAAEGKRAPRAPREERPHPAPAPTLPLFTPAAEELRPPVPAPARGARGEERVAASAAAAPAALTADRRSRLFAGLADLLVHAAVGVAAAAGALLLGARLAPAHWPAFALFLLTFSFLYSVVPLAFWGQTLGMAWAGLLAVNADGQPLAFEQTGLRWLGGLLTCATLGLPLLTARRRSLADVLSRSVTLRRR
ncbi:MAG TPA: RDD family protein [Thermoanaerobaculia bacterium]|nr:RDD family protein [Thermoanaerobaculia bacterium]